MTNKEAIEKLKEILFLTGYKEALELAIYALEQIAPVKMSGDLISREALKTAIEDLYDDTLDGIVKFGIEKAIQLIDNAPTATPEITEKQAILLLINNGWLVNHDKELREKWKRPQGECKACYYYKFTQSYINGIVEAISKNGLTSIDELLETLKREANKNE